MLYICVYIYIGYYNISHLLGKPQGPLLFCSVVGVVVVGAPRSEACFVPGVVLLAPLLALVDVDGPVVAVAAASWAPPFVSNAVAVPALPSSQWNALATVP